jgi:nucleotide-binding universal stress UspA family protein
MAQARAASRILWAIDPLLEDVELQRATAWAIKALTKGSNSLIQPVCLIQDDLVGELRESGQDSLGDVLSRVKLRGVLPLKTLSEPYYTSMRAAAEALIGYAHESGAELIVLGTRARKGVRRWMMGSFVESLVLRSDVPLFVINPHWERIPRFEQILFPTDFSVESRVAFREVIKLALRLGSEIKIFHKMRFELSPPVEVAFNMRPEYRDTFMTELNHRKSEANELAHEARKNGIKASTIVEYRHGGSVEEAVLSIAHKNPGIIAMASRSGKMSAALIGSTTRQIVRHSPFPVWVIHPKIDRQHRARAA